MSEEQWAILRRRIYRSLPYIQLILAGTTVAISDTMWDLIIGLSAVWLISPASGEFSARNVDVALARANDEMMSTYAPTPGAEFRAIENETKLSTVMGTGSNVSRETSADDFDGTRCGDPLCSCNGGDDPPVLIPCAIAHGSADPHVEGCEGWRNPSG